MCVWAGVGEGVEKVCRVTVTTTNFFPPNEFKLLFFVVVVLFFCGWVRLLPVKIISLILNSQ